MASVERSTIVEALEREPLRHIVLLKHLEAYPEATSAYRVVDGECAATLVLLNVAASPYDRRTYPEARYAALVASDDATLTRRLLAHVPAEIGIVFKLASDGDRDTVAERFSLRRTTGVISFTARPGFARDPEAIVTTSPGPAALATFESQHHEREWLLPLLRAGRAFCVMLGAPEAPQSVAFAFENYKRVWEVGGVFTPDPLRGRGLAKRVVRSVLAELAARDRIPRYQVHEENASSIALAESLGLARFLTISHFLHVPARPA
ncbi:MAG: GNAT family N-acetyltransferase [Alphaproteobacteria bacterium]|nr:GNAT family N-acetyltransferase [Alphaproteobacteria bacterium]